MLIQKPANRESRSSPLHLPAEQESSASDTSGESSDLCAFVSSSGELEEAIDGAGRRIVQSNPMLATYARALLRTGRDKVRFIWIDQKTNWLSVEISTDRRGLGLPKASIALRPVAAPFGITLRELDVLTLVAAGMGNEDIAARLEASPRTIAKHVENLLSKMGVWTRAAAAGIAVDQGILRLPSPGGIPIENLAIGSVEGKAHELDTGHDHSRDVRRYMPRPIRIGIPKMVIGMARDDATEMFNGASLAVSELNERGGVLGRPVELLSVDCDVNDLSSLRHAYGMFLNAEVDAVSSGYSVAEAAMQDLMVDYGCPYLHASTRESLVQRVRENPSRYDNVFQVCPSDVEYGPGLARFLASLEERKEWVPRNRRLLALLTSWNDFDVGIIEMERMLSTKGWQVEVLDGFDGGNLDWASAMQTVHRYDPSVVLLGFALPAATISFQKAFLAAPTDTLVHAIYSPSIPIYRQELGDDANGVLWSSTTGVYSDAIGRDFALRYRARMGLLPGRSHAGIAYDRIRLLANAWSRVGNVRAFKQVAADLRTTVHRGVNGAYFFGGSGQSSLAYESNTLDPSISQAHLVFQIQDGRQKILSPQPYAESRFELPHWFSAR